MDTTIPRAGKRLKQKQVNNYYIKHTMRYKNSIHVALKNNDSIVDDDRSKSILLWWFFLFYVLVFKIFLCCWRLMYVFIFLVKLR